MIECLTKMTAPDDNQKELLACQSLAGRLPKPRDLFAGIQGFLTVLPENPLQFHRHGDRYLLRGAPFLHHRFVLVACLCEPGCIVLDGDVFRIEPGHGLLIFPYQNHYYVRLEHPERISWLFTTFEYPASEKLEPLRNTPFLFKTQDLQRLHQVMAAYLHSRKGAREATHDMPLEIALLLSGLLQRQRRRGKDLAGKPLTDGPQAQFLRPLFTYIERHLEGSLRLEDLAGCVHLSPSRLRARFKHTLGIGPGEFIRHTRIHHACSLLNGTELNVTQIAEKCGFNSVFAFSRTFRHVIGKSPTVFRQNL